MSSYLYITDGVNPEPWESPKGSVARAKDKKFYVQMHKPFKLRAFQEDFAETFVNQNPDAMLLDGQVRMEIYVWRNVDREVKANIADATNMQKAIEDALQGILYENDRQVVDCRTVIVAQSTVTEPAIVIKIHKMGDADDDWKGAADATHLLQMKREALERMPSESVQDSRTLPPGDSYF